MNMFLFQEAVNTVNSGWEKWIGEGVAISLIIILLGFLLRALPTWKEIKINEFNVRTKEAEVGGQTSLAISNLATSQTQLATALETLGGTVRDIAIEQKKATENVMILQRVNTNESQQMSNIVEELVERVDALEKGK